MSRDLFRQPASRIFWVALCGASIGAGLCVARLAIAQEAAHRGAEGAAQDDRDNAAPKRAALHVPDGLAVSTWAETPLLNNPTNIDVDARGRIWVTEGVRYRDFRNEAINSTFGRRGDRVVILEDTDGDGLADSSKVFVEDEDLIAPMGISVLGDRVVVSCAPSVIVYTDADGDDVPDDKEVFLTGFGGFDHDHSLHTVVGGPDGRWYLSCGNTGPTVVTDRAGFTFRSGSTYNGGTPYNTENRPGLVSDDGRTWVGGAALRIEHDGTGLTCIGHNFRNPYEVAVDCFGNVWQNDNDDTTSCRIAWLMEGGSAGFASADGTRTWRADQRPGQGTSTAHWHQDDPGVMPAGDITGAGAPTGIAVYEGGLLGDAFDGAILSCDSGRNVVFADRPIADGAGYRWERSELLTSIPPGDEAAAVDDDRYLFRPSDVAVGIDGAIYVADWYDSHVGGHRLTDPAAYGRILRIAAQTPPTGATPTAPSDAAPSDAVPSDARPAKASLASSRAIDLDTIDGQVAALANPAVHVRYAAAEKLRQQPQAALPHLQRLVETGAPRLRARALWILASCGPAGVSTVESALADGDANIRITAFRALRQIDHRVLEHAAKLAVDASPSVRREAALALRDVPLDACRDMLLALADRVDARDRWSIEAFGAACDGKEADIWPAIVDRFGNPPPLAWSQSLAAIAWRLHTPATIAALAERAASETLLYAARKQAIDALAFIADERAADCMVELVRTGPADTRDDCAWWVRDRHTNDWQAYRPADKLPTIMRLASKPDFASGVLATGERKTIDLDISGATSVTLLVTDRGDRATDGRAAWLAARVVGAEGDVPLASLPHEDAAVGAPPSSAPAHEKRPAASDKARGKRRPSKTAADGAASAVDRQRGFDPIAVGIPSQIVFQLPRGATRLVADCALEAIATADREIEFFVLADRSQLLQRVATFRGRLMKRETPLDDKLRLAEQLAATSAGGLTLIELAASGRLDAAVRDSIAPAMYRNPDLTVRALATEHFARPSNGGQPLPPVAELLAKSGDAARGRAVFTSEKAGCVKCHTHTGAGGQIGPDLSKIGSQFDRARILDSILNPSAAIALGYESFAVETDAGQVLVGMIVADGDNIVIRAADGTQSVVPAVEIVSRHRLAASTMPDNVATGLSADELADLLEFLATSRAEGSQK